MVSIIVPIYNVKKFLNDCIDSILRSSYQDFELILVDDGSTDGSEDICDKWAARDERVSVIHQANNRIAAARNNGLSRARGKYILFVDGDDMIHPLMLETLVHAIESGDYDFSMVLGRSIDEGEVARYKAAQPEEELQLKPVEIPQDELMPHLFDLTTFQYQVVWNKLYRKSLIEAIPFMQVPNEDLEWNTRVFLKARRAVLVERELYYYVRHGASIMHRKFGRGIIDQLGTVMMCLDQLPETDRHGRSCCLAYLYKTYFYQRYKSAKKQVPFWGDVKSFGRQMHGYAGKELWHSDLSMIDKLKIVAFYRFPSLYKLLMAHIAK